MKPIRVISLARSGARREAFAERNRHLHFAFHEAVDGHALTRAEVERCGLFAPALLDTYSAGAVGCAISHWQLWNEAVRATGPTTIAEDDAVFRHDFEARAQALLAGLPAGWDLVLWGWNFDAAVMLELVPGVAPALLQFDQARLRQAMDAFQAATVPVMPLRLQLAFGLPAYTLSPGGAARLLAACFPLQDFRLQWPGAPLPLRNVGIDVAAAAAYARLACQACVPPLAATPNEAAGSQTQDGARLRPSGPGLTPG